MSLNSEGERAEISAQEAPMEIRGQHLSYCTNVHPVEALADLEGRLLEDIAGVARRLGVRRFGTGLRLSAAVTDALAADRGRLDALAARMEALGLYLFTANGFPYGDFSSGAIKAGVYAPSWGEDERLRYTLTLAEVISALPGPATRTISTVAGGFRPEGLSWQIMAARLRQAAEGLARIADRTGVHTQLCLEPEPFTTLETTPEALAFFDQQIAPWPEDTRGHLGLCYDCCHQAVFFEDAAENIRQLAARGILGKVQVSSALALSDPGDEAARGQLLSYDEPRYLHQVVAKSGDQRLRALDLSAIDLDDPAWRQAEAWRCHFHVPIHWAGAGALTTTRADWEATLGAIVAEGLRTHIEVETYTWGVLPAGRAARLEDDLIAELEAALAVLRR
ncbi:metabolite traffic protein EboE [Myxococcota bacterium]|nr:metabolite traffic protein EboE [Myxococcota bacterium]